MKTRGQLFRSDIKQSVATIRLASRWPIALFKELTIAIGLLLATIVWWCVFGWWAKQDDVES